MAKHRAAAVRRKIRETSIPLAIMTAVDADMGIELLIQPARYDRTPAYGVLLDIAQQATWGVVFSAVAMLMASALIFRKLLVSAHMMAIAIDSVWLIGFIVRRASDSSTTSVNVASWLLHITILFYSLSLINRQIVRSPPSDI